MAPRGFYEDLSHYNFSGGEAGKETIRAIKYARNNPEALVEIFRGVPGGVTEINQGDWISLSKGYATQHAKRRSEWSEKPWIVISKFVKVKHVFYDHNDINEMAYFVPSKNNKSFINNTLKAGFDPNQSRNPDGTWGSGGPANKLEDKPCFKEWFKDSKIVDEDNKPMVVYHGSKDNSITVFDPERAGDIQYSDWGKGVYFTPSKDSAEYYSQEAIKKSDDLYNSLYEKYQKTKSNEDLKAFQDRGRELSSNPNTIVYNVYLSIKNPLIHKAGSMPDPFLAERAIKEGKDGIMILTGGRLDEIVVFNSNQIKAIDAPSFCDETNINKDWKDELFEKIKDEIPTGIFAEKAGFDPNQPRNEDGTWGNDGPQLTERDEEIIDHYTDEGFVNMNRSLIHQGSFGEAPEKLAKDVEDLNKALKKLPKFEGTVYRGIDFGWSSHDLFSFKHSIKFSKNGIVFKGFTSTSKNRSFPNDILQGGQGGGKFMLEIISKTGRDIGNYAHSEGEEEVIFLSGTRFKVLDYDFDSPIKTIKLIEL